VGDESTVTKSGKQTHGVELTLELKRIKKMVKNQLAGLVRKDTWRSFRLHPGKCGI